MRCGIVIGRFVRVVVDLDLEGPCVGPLSGRIQGNANDVRVRDVRMIEHAHGDFGRQRIRQVGQRASLFVDGECRVRGRRVERTLRRQLLFTDRRRRIAGIDVLLIREQVEQAGVDLACRIEHAVLLRVAHTHLRWREDAMRDPVVGTRLSAGVSLKLRMAMRFIDSPSSGRSMAPDTERSATTGAATGS